MFLTIGNHQLFLNYAAGELQEANRRSHLLSFSIGQLSKLMNYR
jgi:hypothetical protein